ncbi:MAG: ATP-binding domain-containing protein [Deltaproteobacteria bacterium]|jgi:hypothetical protein|nr:ATP-binding domain-containing protein [Deltaproteobacteria bacterium]
MSILSHADIIALGLEAKGVLEACDRIVDAARGSVGAASEADFGPYGPLSAELRESDAYKALRCLKVPIVARVGAKDEANRTRVYYVCPCDPPPGLRRTMLVNAFTSFGRILSLKPGDIFETPDGERLAITEKTTLTPIDYGQKRDIYDAIFEWGDQEVRLKSLREFVDRMTEPRYSVKHPADEKPKAPGDTLLVLEGDYEDEVEVAIDEETEILSATPVVRLADQAFHLGYSTHLDQRQDQICRQPLGSRLLVLGQPGTGKTLTMIRRLDFKIAREALADEERAIIDQSSEVGYPPHPISWRLFSPSNILKNYVSSAFKEALIPGFEDNVVAWTDYRKELARNHFGILQTPTGGKLILSSNLNYLSDKARNHVDRWFEDFNLYQWQYFVSNLKRHALRLAQSADPNLASLGARSQEALEQCQPGALARLYIALEPRIPTISGYDSILSQAVTAATEQIIKALSERESNFLLTVTELYESLPKRSAKEPAPGTEESYLLAYSFLAQVIREKSRAVALDRAYRVDERRTRFWEFLAERLDETSLASLGHNCLSLTSLRKLNCAKAAFAGSYFESLIESYLAFRKAGPEWYVKAGLDNQYVNELELDVILLAILEASSALLWQDYLKPGRFTLGPILSAHKKEMRDQILVDEAVDFSPVQLKCAMNLTIPSSGSFYATGDLNQRFTPWGAKSTADFEWAIQGLSESTLLANYRVSSPLNDLAKAVFAKSGAQYAIKTSFASEGTYKPVLLDKSPDLENTVAWLADRIREITRKIGQTPAIAVTMNSETALGGVAKALTLALDDSRLTAAVYRDNESPEEDAPIRVINLKRIKGLEFEAVFLLDLDKMVAGIPDLYRQHLYVAISRAATFFGATCGEGLPEPLANLAPFFGENWA